MSSQDVRSEISRFESVHPSIYAIYDLIEQIPERFCYLSDQIREHVVSIEDSFVNSQEWTLSRGVTDIRLGVLGSTHSGKSALVHRYLTGSYMQDESPEGGRFKKEVLLEGQSVLLLIRDEGGPPDEQFSHWVDGVIFVFSLENEESFQMVWRLYTQLANYRNTAELPLILVGTQDAISESNPRLIDDARARRLAHELRRCSYYETCATYGLNVERVFQDACQKITVSRLGMMPVATSRPTTPQHARTGALYATSACVPPSPPPPPPPPPRDGSQLASSTGSKESMSTQTRDKASDKRSRRPGESTPAQEPELSECHLPTRTSSFTVAGSNTPQLLRKEGMARAKEDARKSSARLDTFLSGLHSTVQPPATNHHYSDYNEIFAGRSPRDRTSLLNMPTEPCQLEEKSESKDHATPNSTPTQSRKQRRKSNIFKKGDDDKDKDKKVNGIGSGRAIPVKQGLLYKRSTKGLNREWKKKYVALSDDACLTYHPNMHDYMDMVRGKEIDLKRATVKVPGIACRGATKPGITSNGLLKAQVNQAQGKGAQNAAETVVISNDSMTSGGDAKTKETPGVKKRHRRAKSTAKSSANDGYESDGYEFNVVSIDNKQWQFEAHSAEERDDWVNQIENCIMNSLQLNQSGKPRSASAVDPALVRSIRDVAGNQVCADCGQQDPDWASLNLGALVCIECSGVHRQLGTHISRVRSLSLDDWPSEFVAVMLSIGNTLANSVWEAAVAVNAANRKKPECQASREEKETWIRAKYERREFLPPLPYPDAPLQQQLIDAIAREDTRQVILCLALAGDAVNSPYSKQDPRAAIHIAATLGNLVYIQLLIWYNGSTTVVDHEGRNAFFYAMASRKPEVAEFLRQNGCPEQHLAMHPGSAYSQQAWMVAQQQATGVSLPRRRSNTSGNQPPS